MSIIKNPIVLGVLAGAITYIYLVWSKKNKKDPKKEISLITPIIVAIAVCLVAYLYFSPGSSVAAQDVEAKQLMGSSAKYHFADPAAPIQISSDSPASFHLISKGVNIPNNVPEVFIETY